MADRLISLMLVYRSNVLSMLGLGACNVPTSCTIILLPFDLPFLLLLLLLRLLFLGLLLLRLLMSSIPRRCLLLALFWNFASIIPTQRLDG